MSKYLTYGGNLTLIDLEKGGGVLNETKATLTEKGKKLVYQASTDEMRLKIDLSTATGKVNVKYCDYKNIQPVLKY